MIDDREYERLKDYIAGITRQKVRDKKIRALGVNPLYHNQPKRMLEVGRSYADLEPDTPSEQIIAIFEIQTLFCVCTPRRGAGEGLPYFFTRESVYRVEEMKE